MRFEVADMSAFRRMAARGMGLVFLAGALGGGMAGVPFLEAQIKADAKKPLQYDVAVALKLVQVYVSGKDGHPVGDLDAAEFEVFDNGRSVPVTHFEKHVLGHPGDVSAPSKEVRLSRKFLLIFDFGFIDAKGVLKAKTAGLHFLDTELRPDDQVGLLTFTSFRGLVLHEYMTTHHNRIRGVVNAFGLHEVTARTENPTDDVYSIDLAKPENEGAISAKGKEEPASQRRAQLETGQRVEETQSQGYVDRVRSFIDGLTNLAVALRYVPGYKNIIIFSGGIARQVLFGRPGAVMSPGSETPQDFVQQLKEYDAAQPDAGLRNDFTKMVDEFKAANSPIYALDVSRTTKEADVSSGQVTAMSSRKAEGADSLKQLASGTGGRFFGNTTDYKNSLAEIQNVTGSFYVLGFSVPEKWDGKFHKVKVRVKRKGCDVAAQGGYFNPKPFKDFSGIEKLMHMTDLALSDEPQLQVPLPLPVSAQPVTVNGELRLLAFSRASRLVMADVLGKKAEAFLLLCQAEGKVLDVKRFRLTYPDPPSETYFPALLTGAKPGRYICRVVLRNLETGRAARGTFQITMPERSTGSPVADPPLLLTEDPHARDLAGSDESSLSKLFGYDAGSYAPLVGEAPAGTNKLFAALRFIAGEADRPLELSASLKEAAAAGAVAVPVSVLKGSEGGFPRHLFVELATGELKSGRYTLTFFVKNQAGEPAAVTSSAFLVKPPAEPER